MSGFVLEHPIIPTLFPTCTTLGLSVLSLWFRLIWQWHGSQWRGEGTCTTLSLAAPHPGAWAAALSVDTSHLARYNFLHFLFFGDVHNPIGLHFLDYPHLFFDGTPEFTKGVRGHLGGFRELKYASVEDSDEFIVEFLFGGHWCAPFYFADISLKLYQVRQCLVCNFPCK